MGVCDSPDIFQEQMSEFMAGLEFVRVHFNNSLAIAKSDFKDHLRKLEQRFSRVQQADPRINVEKSFFAKSEVEHLGFKINRKGIMPMAKKAEAVQAIQPPKTCKECR